MNKPCPKCGHTEYTYNEKGPHIGAYCAKCGTWIKWMPKNSVKPIIKELPITEELPINDDTDLPWED